MKVRFVPPTLRGLDRLEADVLGVAIFTEDRPLQGVAGLADWRLNGQLSRLITEARFEGDFREKALLPCGHRVGAARLLMFGLGDPYGYDEARLSEAAVWMWDAFEGLRAPSVAMPIPGAHGSKTRPGRAADLVVGAAERAYEGSRVPLRLLELVVPADEQRAIQSALEGRRMTGAVEFVDGAQRP